MKRYTYPALKVNQGPNSPSLVMFGAPASDIESWSGIPQKKEISRGETTGFQRNLDRKRLQDLQVFFQNEKNVIQNPLLCATRFSESSKVTFKEDFPTSGNGDTHFILGHIEIENAPLESVSLIDLLKKLKSDLEMRMPSLANESVRDQVLKMLRQKAQLFQSTESDFGVADDTDDELATDDEQKSNAEISFDSESHIREFWEEISARIILLDELKIESSLDEFLGFTKDALISYLRPIVVVDGQHRLKGAVEAARRKLDDSERKEWVRAKLKLGSSPDEIQESLLRDLSRKLPVSLLLSDDPAEHVFQFVVVNQRATPIGRALLGTIVSTTLSNEELDRVAKRLTDAKIPLQDSRAINYLSKHPNSPFCGLVERGLDSDKSQELLPWTVLGGLAKIFRFLEGGKLYNFNVDYARGWREKCLSESAVVRSSSEPYATWSAPDGPWREVFISFWTEVRDRLGNTNDRDSTNFWGKARTSQLFNMISLTILASDFFRYLYQRELPIDGAECIAELVDGWLKGLDVRYFARKWDLTGTKKESPGIRKQWARLWTEYRDSPPTKRGLPSVSEYRIPAKG